MNFEEFKEKVESLLSELEPSGDYVQDDDIDNYWLDKEKKLLLTIHDFNMFINVNIGYTANEIYRSARYNNLEELYDELIIFKELILPKYL